ncbi:MAG: hypothetical protein HRU15_08715 [Planctomycetes bacterium]|nr:hypothetical protein [Planctomycetota bacterium]
MSSDGWGADTYPSGIYSISSKGIVPVFLASDITAYNKETGLIGLSADSEKRLIDFETGNRGVTVYVVTNGVLNLEFKTSMWPNASTVSVAEGPKFIKTYYSTSEGSSVPSNERLGLMVADAYPGKRVHKELSNIIQLWLE